MGLTGLGLALFVLFHMLGNLLIFAGAETYNLYAHKLSGEWIILFEWAPGFYVFGSYLFSGFFNGEKQKKPARKITSTG